MTKSRGANTQRPRRRVVRKIFAGIGILLIVLAGAGALWNFLATRHSRAENPPPGRLYSINGHPMHLYCTGTGSPTIVLESGHGDDFTVWGKVQPALSRVTRTCSYDRAGFGWSEAQPGERDALSMAKQLNMLLQAAGIGEPVVLVGHSAGGLYSHVYASQFPGRVAGIVLVDATSSNPLPKPRIIESLDHHSRLEFAMVKASVALGIARAVGQCDAVVPGLEAYAKWITATTCYYPTADVYVREDDALAQSRKEAGSAGSMGDIPLVVLSQDPKKPIPPFLRGHISEADWQASQTAHEKDQEGLLAMSAHSRQVIATGSGHYIQYERPDVVVAETSALVEQVRSHADGRPGI